MRVRLAFQSLVSTSGAISFAAPGRSSSRYAHRPPHAPLHFSDALRAYLMSTTQRERDQRQHEDYWASCWAVALGRHLAAEVHTSRPSVDPPDVEFPIERPEGTAVTSWGELTGTYYDSADARSLWGSASKGGPGLYWAPDAVMGARAPEPRPEPVSSPPHHRQHPRQRIPMHRRVDYYPYVVTRTISLRLHAAPRDGLGASTTPGTNPVPVSFWRFS